MERSKKYLELEIGIDEYGDTLLIKACKDKNKKEALKLLKFDCNPTHVNNELSTALIYSCMNNIPEVAMTLLNLDCNPSQVDKTGNTAFIYACFNGMKQVALKLLTLNCNPHQINNTKRTGLFHAIRMNLNEVVYELLKLSSINVSLIDVNGSTPLIMACYNCNVDIALKLLDYNLRSLTHINCDGDSAITIAYQNKLSTVIKKIADRLYLQSNPPTSLSCLE